MHVVHRKRKYRNALEALEDGEGNLLVIAILFQVWTAINHCRVIFFFKLVSFPSGIEARQWGSDTDNFSSEEHNQSRHEGSGGSVRPPRTPAGVLQLFPHVQRVLDDASLQRGCCLGGEVGDVHHFPWTGWWGQSKQHPLLNLQPGVPPGISHARMWSLLLQGRI